MNQSRGYRFSGAFWLFFGLCGSYAATRLGVGSPNDPGAGFIFFWGGVVVSLLSLKLVLEPPRPVGIETQPAAERSWARVAGVLGAILVFAYFLERLGFLLTTFILMMVLLFINGVSRLAALAVAAAAALGTYGIFELWLKIRLPKGLFGF